jgi:hypothetical protein
MTEMKQEVKTYQFYIPVNQVYPFKKAANENGIDVIISNKSEEFVGSLWREVTVIASLTTIFSLGFFTGLNVYQSIAISPLEDAIDIFQNKIDKILKKQDDDKLQ